MAGVDYEILEKRLGKQHLARRLKIQAHHVSRLFGAGKTFFHIENIRSIHRLIQRMLQVAGLYKRGRHNALNIQVVEQPLPYPDLPVALDGFRILHLSDTHIDGSPEILPVLQQKIAPLKFDICVITGDFREGTFEDYDTPTRRMVELCKTFDAPTYAVLGNHDCIEMVPLLEEGGIQVLLNENTRIEHNGSSLYLAGVDDPHYYETDNLEKALNGIPDDAFSILLAHSPEITRKAGYAEIDLYLCGHTHGGQICLPGGRPLITNASCPKNQRNGLWNYHEMLGYTSRGAGTSSVNVRFNCLPEITVHTLRKAQRP